MAIYLRNFPGPAEFTVSQVAKMVEIQVYRLLILSINDKQGQRVAGFALCANYGGTTPSSFVHLDYMAIADSVQGKGMGTLFMRTLIENFKMEAVSSGTLALMTFECESKLLNFYGRLGAITATGIKPGYYDGVPYHFNAIPLTDPPVPVVYSSRGLKRIRKMMRTQIHSFKDSLKVDPKD